jgi:diamine N-acetyltransferase
MTECRWRSSVDECQRRKFSAKNPEDMLKLGSVASMVLPKYLMKLLAKTIGICGGDTDMKIKLEPINDTNRKAVLALTVREDQPFVAQNDYSLSEADEANARAPGTARPFAIYAGEKIVGFCMLALDPEDENPVDRYCLWRLMIDKNEQGKGYGQAALHEVIKYFKENGVDTIYLSTAPENEVGLHVYHKAGFRETAEIEDGEAILVLKL